MSPVKNFFKKNWIIVLSALYILSPLDILPEFLAPLGIIDDIGVLATTIVYKFLQERKNYKGSEKQDK